MSVTGLRTGWVVRFDGRQHVMWRHGEVVFAGDLILFVGRDYPGPVDCWVDYDEALIGPGFIDLDALDDVDSTVLPPEKGPVEWMGRLWSQEYLDVGPRDAYSPGQELFKYRYAFSRLIRNGVTTAMPINSMFYRRWAEG
ncbi:hypothetical protein [Marinobacterium aestuariivivens]|uniref:Uncharacterized protein n=1 Tax=Marinobacterium aestuariivivens TaxID=1698799 RepID=A0ABW2A918_9GAMM